MIKEAVILAGGLGSRFLGRTHYMPKGFIEIDKTPMVELSIQKLLKCDVNHIIIGTGHCNEYYDHLKSKYPEIETIKNENYINTSSMGTLARCAPLIKEDFFLLESDLIYEIRAFDILNKDKRQNVILASGETKSGDEVYLSTYPNQALNVASKNIKEIDAVAGELTGISKISLPFLQKMLTYYSSNLPEKIKIDYENVFAAVNKTLISNKALTPKDEGEDAIDNSLIYVNKDENFTWCEVDDEGMLERALNTVYPRIKEKEGKII